MDVTLKTEGSHRTKALEIPFPIGPISASEVLPNCPALEAVRGHFSLYIDAWTDIKKDSRVLRILSRGYYMPFSFLLLLKRGNFLSSHTSEYTIKMVSSSLPGQIFQAQKKHSRPTSTASSRSSRSLSAVAVDRMMQKFLRAQIQMGVLPALSAPGSMSVSAKSIRSPSPIRPVVLKSQDMRSPRALASDSRKVPSSTLTMSLTSSALISSYQSRSLI